jgi:dTMP kinase
MKIYFGASVSNDRSMLPVYKEIVDELKKLGHTILSEHVVDPDLELGEGLTPEKLFAREAATVDKADAVIAEVSLPSWGTAFLMEHALKHGKPVLALFYKDTKGDLPMMIQGHPDFFIGHYSEDNISAVLKRNLKHFDQMKHTSGKLIVIDGADGAGKATQTRKLMEYFENHRMKHKYISFPRYATSFHGHHVGRFLRGEFGGNSEISPYLSSLAFALDRLTARDEMMEWLEAGNFVVADRYVSASMAHQASKLPEAKRQEFIDWIYDMEYKEHKLPKESIVLFLYVPVEVSQRLLAEATAAKGKDGKAGKDMAEIDVEHQRRSIEQYQHLAEQFEHWQLVKCVDEDNELLSVDEIHQKIVAILQERGIVLV